MLTRLFNLLCRVSPALKRRLWHRWYQFLAQRYATKSWSFMNYGYAPLTDDEEPLPLADEDEADRYCIQLYHHVASAIELTDKDVLEVGSGRGGGASYVKRYLDPHKMVGVDFSPNAVAFCNEKHQVPNLTFEVGDAEQLPFDDQSFDAVLNVESSHCYPNFAAFVAEVARVLRPGGHFLFADLRPQGTFPTLQQQLEDSSLEIVSETDIAPNVVRALELDDARKRSQIEETIGKRWAATFARFAGVKGSPIFEELRDGREAYWSYVLRKKQ